MQVRIVALGMLAIASVASAQTKDHAPVALNSSTKMSQDKAGSESWTYMKSGLSLKKYEEILVLPTAVYKGSDAQFGSISAADRQKYAAIFTEALSAELAQSMPVAMKAGPKVLTFKVTLLGAEKTKGGVATATRATPLGLGMNALKSVAGKPGTFTGSVLYAVEVHDGGNNELLAAAVRRRSPDPLDVPSTLSTDDTVRSIARDVSKQIRQRLEKARNGG